MQNGDLVELHYVDRQNQSVSKLKFDEIGLYYSAVIVCE